MNAINLVTLDYVLIFLVHAALLFLIWDILLWLTKQWRTKATRLRQKIDSALEKLLDQRRELGIEAKDYPPDMPVPYRSTAQEVRKRFKRFDEAHAEVSEAIATRANEVMVKHEAWWQHVPHHLWYAPRFWYTRQRALERTRSQLRALRGQLIDIEDDLKSLRSKPIETAAEARRLRKALAQADESLMALMASGLQGEALDTVVNAFEGHHAKLQRLPTYLLADSESRVVRQARADEISTAWHVLNTLGSHLEEQMAQIDRWQQIWIDLCDHVEEMEHALDSASAQLTSTHTSIDTQAFAERFDAVQARGQEVSDRFAVPTVDDLPWLEAESKKITRQADQLIGKLVAVEALRISLEGAIQENTSYLGEIEVQIRQLAEVGRYPLDRVPYQAELDHLRSRSVKTESAWSGEQRQTSAQLEKALASARVVSRQAQGLLQQLAEARADRRRLKEIIAETDVTAERSGIDWSAWAEDLHARTADYAPENWQRDGTALNVTDILTDAHDLKSRIQTWIPRDIDEPLSPSTLHQRVIEIERLIADVEAFQDRLDAITLRLQEIQSIETSARARVTIIGEALQRLDNVADGTLPKSLAEEENHWNAMRSLLAENEGLRRALDEPGRGTVDDKAAQTAEWTKACQQTLSDWHRVLQRELKEAHATLITHIDELQQVASLNGEPAVQRAQKLIEAGAGQEEVAPLPLNDDVKLVDAETKAVVGLAGHVADDLQALAQLDQVTAHLDSTVIAPLAEPVNRWRTIQREAEGAFIDLQNLERTSSKLWPPVSCDTAPVEAQLGRIQEARNALYHDEGMRVKTVIKKLDKMVELYKGIVKMVEEREKAYHEVREDLDATLDRLEAWCTDLAAYAKQHKHNPAIGTAVRARLDEVEATWTHLQIQYEQTSQLISGAEARRSLERLWRQAHRDLPLGIGLDTIPPIAIERRH